jgi:hypothetical protein
VLGALYALGMARCWAVKERWGLVDRDALAVERAEVRSAAAAAGLAR